MQELQCSGQLLLLLALILLDHDLLNLVLDLILVAFLSSVALIRHFESQAAALRSGGRVIGGFRGGKEAQRRWLDNWMACKSASLMVGDCRCGVVAVAEL